MSFASTRCWKPLQIHGKWTLFPSLCPIFDVWCWRFLTHFWSSVTGRSVQTNRSKYSSTATSQAKARGLSKSCSTPTLSSETRPTRSRNKCYYLGSYCLEATHQKEHLEICSADLWLTTDQFITHTHIIHNITRWEKGAVKAWIWCNITDQMPQTALNLLVFLFFLHVWTVLWKESTAQNIFPYSTTCKPTSLRTGICIQHT